MADDSPTVVLRVHTAELEAGLKKASGSVQQFADGMRGSLSSMGTAWKAFPTAANEADKSLGGLMGTLKNFKAEQVQQSRSARFFAGEIAGIVPMSGAASSALQGLMSAGFELGTGITKVALGFAAFEVIKVAVGLVGEETKIAAGQMQALGSLTKIHTDVMKVGMESVSEATHKATASQAAYNATMAAGAGPLKQYDAEFKRVAEAGISTWAKLNDIFGDGSLRQAYSETLGAIRAKAEASASALRALADATAAATEEANRANQAKLAQQAVNKLNLEAYEKEVVQLAKVKEALQAIAQYQAEAWTAMELGNLGAGDRKAFMAAQPDWMKNAAALSQQTPGQQADSYSQVEIDMAGTKDQHTAAEALEKLRAASKQATAEMTKEWMAVGDALGASVGKGFADIITGTKSVAQAMAGMAKSILSTIIETMKKVITSYILGAEAAAAFSQAGIPVIGPALAAAAVATMAGLLGGLAGGLPSAATGWDRLPSDQVVQAHRGDRILTAYDTERMDRLEAAFGTGGGGQTVINLSFIDVRGAEDFLERNRVGLVKVINRAAKDRVHG